MPETLKFYVLEDFQFEIGKDKKAVTVPRMSFLTGEKVINKIAEIQSKDLKTAIELLVGVKADPATLASGIDKAVLKIIKERNFDNLIELLTLISEDTINMNLLETSNCQFGEMVKILICLVEANFSSLKNLSASLQASNLSAK
jgi:hypothetical protein